MLMVHSYNQVYRNFSLYYLQVRVGAVVLQRVLLLLWAVDKVLAYCITQINFLSSCVQVGLWQMCCYGCCCSGQKPTLDQCPGGFATWLS